MQIVALYASLLALLFVALSIKTLRLRGALKIAVGDGGNPLMLRAMRLHSNFAEYVPLALILLFLMEGRGAYPAFVHLLGLCLLVGRLAHAYGVSQVREDLRFRVAGMALTFFTLLSSAAYLLFAFVRGTGAMQ